MTILDQVAIELEKNRLRAPMENLQYQVDEWVKLALGEESLRNPKERALRFLEEAFELAQSIRIPEEILRDLLGFVYSRPVGETHQELGGVMLTLLAAASSLELSAQLELRRELERVQAPEVIERVRRRQVEKKERFKTDTAPPSPVGVQERTVSESLHVVQLAHAAALQRHKTAEMFALNPRDVMTGEQAAEMVRTMNLVTDF